MKQTPIRSWDSGLSTDMQINFINFKWIEDIDF